MAFTPYTSRPKHKTRTPADIGREIAEAKRRIVELNAELATVPPSVLELSSVHRTGGFTFTPRTELGGMRLVRSGSQSLSVSQENVGRLKAWLNHYYPEA